MKFAFKRVGDFSNINVTSKFISFYFFPNQKRPYFVIFNTCSLHANTLKELIEKMRNHEYK